MRLHDLLEKYLNSLEVAVAKLPAYAESYAEEILTAERANVRIRLRFDSGYLLEINEAVVAEESTLVTLGYRYHFQNDANVLMFRYDDTPHFPALPTFPHHKHTRDTVIAHNKPNLLDVLQEAAGWV
ncbi:hypothetical protein J9253_02700 [Thiothrix litoralis]|uniref:Uncharacterized protein n=1 Tax=Thiothrix litoralis TaxID=2891210 RepID=A0ABX7WZ16_9GAMM|nr:DUF6516 family protein [Thiothrix litoralis]QTR46874.1 hypothetical protein J9253_02700 [Thiothrix litoralis]